MNLSGKTSITQKFKSEKIMSLIVEESKHPFLKAELSVMEKTKGEVYEPFKIISLQINDMGSFTPSELIDLGNWLIAHGRSIKNRYTSEGKLRKK